MIGGNGPKAQRYAVRHADIWSGYADELASVEEVGPRIASLEAICAEEGRDPSAIGLSVGVQVHPLAPSGARLDALSGSAQQIADAFRTVQEAGYTRLEIMLDPGTIEAFEVLGPVLEQFDTGRG